MRFSFLIVLFFISTAPFAQIKKPGVTLGASILYASPQDEFKNFYKGGIGGELKAGVGMGKTYIVASLGYSIFAAQSENNTGNLTYKPVKVGVKQYFLAKRLFVNGDLGLVYIKDEVMNSANSRFSADIGGGVRLAGLEAGIYLDNIQKDNGNGYYQNIQFKLGYNFTL